MVLSVGVVFFYQYMYAVMSRVPDIDIYIRAHASPENQEISGRIILNLWYLRSKACGNAGTDHEILLSLTCNPSPSLLSFCSKSYRKLYQMP